MIPKGYLIPIADFWADLCKRLEGCEGEVSELRQAGAVYRADTLFEAVADLSDALCGHEAGRLGEDVARTEALRVCRLAVLLWLSVVGEDENVEVQRIDDLTLEHISSDGSGTQADLEAYKAACRNYQRANECSEREAMEVIYGNGDFGARVHEWAPEEAAAADAQGNEDGR